MLVVPQRYGQMLPTPKSEQQKEREPTMSRNDIHWSEIILPEEIVSIAHQMGISFEEAQDKLERALWRESFECGRRHYTAEIDGWQLTGWKEQNHPGIFVSVTKKQEARTAIIRWAQSYFAPEIDDPPPEVAILSIAYNEQDDEWIAELEISSSADNPTVTFWFDNHHPMEKNRLHIANIEY